MFKTKEWTKPVDAYRLQELLRMHEEIIGTKIPKNVTVCITENGGLQFLCNDWESKENAEEIYYFFKRTYYTAKMNEMFEGQCETGIESPCRGTFKTFK
jgi:hypothetical protein